MAKSRPQTIFFTRADVTAYATTLFPHEDIATLMSTLDCYGIQDHESERDRVHMAILYLSTGDVDRLLHNIQCAKQDYRDVLYWAEYAEHDTHRIPYEW